jgi:hypothetical protein
MTETYPNPKQYLSSLQGGNIRRSPSGTLLAILEDEDVTMDEVNELSLFIPKTEKPLDTCLKQILTEHQHEIKKCITTFNSKCFEQLRESMYR